MRKTAFFLMVIAFLAGTEPYARAEIIDGGAQKMRIVVLGLEDHGDYDFIVDGINRLSGVSGLTLARISQGSAVFTGFVSTDVEMFKNDVQGLVSDRFSYSDKNSGDVLEITLRKL